MPEFTTWEIQITNRSRSLRAAHLVASYTGLSFSRIRDKLQNPPFKLPRSLPLARAASIKKELEECGCQVELKKVVTEVIADDEVELQEEQPEEAALEVEESSEITLTGDSFRIIPDHRRRWWLWGIPGTVLLLLLIWAMLPDGQDDDNSAGRRHSQAQQLLLALDQELNVVGQLLGQPERITAARGLLLRLEAVVRGITDEEKKFLLERELQHQQDRLERLILVQSLPVESRRFLDEEIAIYHSLPVGPIFPDSIRISSAETLADYFDLELEAFFSRLRYLKVNAELDSSFLAALARVEALVPVAGGEHPPARLHNLLHRPEIENQRELARRHWVENPQLTLINRGDRLHIHTRAYGADSLRLISNGGDTLLPFVNNRITLPTSWWNADLQRRGHRLEVERQELRPRALTDAYREPEHAEAILQLLSDGRDQVRFSENATVVMSAADNDSPFRNALEMTWLLFNLSGREPAPLIVAAHGRLAVVPSGRVWDYFMLRYQRRIPLWQAFLL